MGQGEVQQGISQILEMLSNMSDNPHSARNVAAAAGGRYVGSALNTPSMGFMTFGGNMGHNPMQMGSQDFANSLMGLGGLVAPSLNRLFSPYHNPDPDRLFAENEAQVAQASLMTSVAKVMSTRLETSLGLEEGGGAPLARLMTSQFFSGPLTEERIQLLSRFNIDRNKELQKGLMDTGVSTIGLQQFGLIGSLTKRDQLSLLRDTIEKAAGDTEGLNSADTLGTAMVLGDPRMDLALSLESKGFGNPEKLAKTTESLKRAKELTGMSSRQTLGLLAEVYDNVIEGVLPDIDKFVDRMMRLERQGVSVTEFSSTVQNMRGKLGRAGVKDGEVAISVVENALGNRESMAAMQWRNGNKNFNQRGYEGDRLADLRNIGESAELNALGIVMELTGVKVAGKSEKEIQEQMQERWADWTQWGLDSNMVEILQSGDQVRLVNAFQRGEFGAGMQDALARGANQGYAAATFRSDGFTLSTIKDKFKWEMGLSSMHKDIQRALSVSDPYKRNDNAETISQMFNLANTDYKTQEDRKAAAKVLGIHINEDGSYSKGSKENGDLVELSSEIFADKSQSLIYNQNIGFLDIGRSRVAEELTAALGMPGIIKSNKSRTQDKKNVDKLLKKFANKRTSHINGEGDTVYDIHSKVSADSLFGLMLEASTSIYGEKNYADATDFQGVFNTLKDNFGGEQWDDAAAKIRKRVEGNSLLKDVINFGDTTDSVGVGNAWNKAWNENEANLAKDGLSSEDREHYQGIREMMKSIMASTKLGGGEVSKEFEEAQKTAVAAETTAKNTGEMLAIMQRTPEGRQRANDESLESAEPVLQSITARTPEEKALAMSRVNSAMGYK